MIDFNKYLGQEPKDFRIALRRAQIYRTKQGLDITVKSAKGWARKLAPTWKMVLGHKKKEITNEEYTKIYLDKLKKLDDQQKLPILELRDLGIQWGNQVVFLCYCPDGKFCHTHLLIDYLVETYSLFFKDGRIK